MSLPNAGLWQAHALLLAHAEWFVSYAQEYLLSCTQPGLWEYSVAVQSDQSELALVEDIVREKLFLHLHREIPYVITQVVL